MLFVKCVMFNFLQHPKLEKSFKYSGLVLKNAVQFEYIFLKLIVNCARIGEKTTISFSSIHGILYNSSASVNQQFHSFHKISSFLSLFKMIFHVINTLN